MILVAILSMSAATTVQTGVTLQRRHAETELLRIGEEFERALASYGAVTPVGASKHPRELQDLLLDPRLPSVRRHLRAVRPDPITGSLEWGLLRGPDGGIVALHSLSIAAPIKVSGFPVGLEHLAGAARYADWKFGLTATVGVRPALQAPVAR
jgi:hypothetical protein